MDKTSMSVKTSRPGSASTLTGTRSREKAPSANSTRRGAPGPLRTEQSPRYARLWMPKGLAPESSVFAPLTWKSRQSRPAPRLTRRER
jgi:hypothetical protein